MTNQVHRSSLPEAASRPCVAEKYQELVGEIRPASSLAALDLSGPRKWDRMTCTSDKAAVFSRDVFSREAWATLVHGLGEEQAYRFAERVALLWVRPDAFAAGATRRVLAAAGDAGFRALAVRPVRLERCGVRSLWGYAARWATAEGLWLLEAIAALGPGLMVLYADEEWRPGGQSASVRMTVVKGVGDPAVRAKGTLREVAASPNLALTMVHAADEGADLVRELGVFVPWAERLQVVVEAARRLASGATCPLEQAIRSVEAEFASITAPPLQLSGMAGEPTADVGPLLAGPLDRRWAKVQAAALRWRLFSSSPASAWWRESVTAP